MAHGERDPQWIRVALGAVAHEWAAFGRTAWAATVAPARFAQQWADGEREALNPLACILNALAVVTASEVLWRLVARGGNDLPPWLDLLRPALQLFNSAVTVSLFHFPLVLLGGRRPWRTSFGVALFVTSGPMLPLYMARNALFPISFTAAPPPMDAAHIGFLAVLTVLLVGYLVVMLAGAHRVARWRVALAFALGSGALGALLLVVKIVTRAR